jgi:LysR family hydrogen peroxide-inducible transcriptional activator
MAISMRAYPNLRHLAYLVALAEHRHFGKAAAASAVTQSTLSAGIRELETILGVQVAERTKRSVILTPIGHQLAEKAARLLRAADDMLDIATQSTTPFSGTIALGTIPTIGPYLLPRIIPALRQRFPALRFALREDKTGALLDRLAHGRLDLVLIAFPYETEGLETMMLFDDAYRFACAASHPLAAAARVELAQLTDEPLMLLERDHCLHSHALPLLEAVPEIAEAAFSATSLPTLVAMVAEGMGTTLLPDLAITGGIAGGDIAVRAMSGETNVRSIGLAWRRQSGRAKTFRDIGAFLRTWAKDEIHPWRG